VATPRRAPFRLRADPASRSSGRQGGEPASLHDATAPARRIAEVPPSITDGACSPDGRAFVLRDYSAADPFAVRDAGGARG
jgi:hypothetical protein